MWAQPYAGHHAESASGSGTALVPSRGDMTWLILNLVLMIMCRLLPLSTSLKTQRSCQATNGLEPVKLHGQAEMFGSDSMTKIAIDHDAEGCSCKFK